MIEPGDRILYFGSVRFFKHVIVGVTVLLIVIPCVICFILGSQLNKEKEENEKLRSEIGSSRIEEYENGCSADELFELYRDSLNDKQEFLRLLYENDPAGYGETVLDIEEDKEAPADTSVPEETPAGSVTSGDEVTEAVTGTEAEAEADAVPVMAENTEAETTAETEAPETEPEFTHTAEPGNAAGVSYDELFPDLYAEVPENIIYNDDADHVYLTFDDGPSKYTDSILNYLEMYDIKATFFVVPDGSAESNARLKRIANAGHTIGIHTATHEYNKIYASVEAYLEDFKTAYDRVYEATGIKCCLFRFPGGSINDYNEAIRDDLIAEMTRRGFIYFDWNVDSSDALGATWTEMYNNLTSQTKACSRAVILMHDYNGGYNTILVLEDIIRWLISNERAYKLDRLTEFVRPVQF